MAYNTVRLDTFDEDLSGPSREQLSEIVYRLNDALKQRGLRFVEHGGSEGLGWVDYRLEECDVPAAQVG